MNFDDVSVTMLETQAKGARARPPGHRVAANFQANFDAVRDLVQDLRKERDVARACQARLQRDLGATRAHARTSVEAVKRACADELKMARTLIAALEQHTGGVEKRLVQARRELARERTTTAVLREHLRPR